MKKISTLVFMVVTFFMFTQTLHAQTCCPTITSYYYTQLTPGVYKATVVYTNTYSNKSIRVKVFGLASSVCFTNCFAAQTSAGSHTYISPSFSCSPTGILVETYSSEDCEDLCASTLPVSLTIFDAVRSGNTVLLSWQTASEQNSKGFAIEKNESGTWKEVYFISSKSNGGNSDNLLSYQYTDNNFNKGVTQYRLRQEDMNQKSLYSNVVMVHGDKQIGNTIVYPNPSSDGKVNIFFLTAEKRCIDVVDISGNIIKKITTENNSISIDKLGSGMYLLKITDKAGEQSVEKFIVN